MTDATLTAEPAPQCMTALRRANEVRLARAALKRRVSEGTITASEVIVTCPWEAASMTIGELLVSQHRWAWTRARNLLTDLGVSEMKTLGTFTDRQRHMFARALR
jgi:hypothetical protein